MPRLKINISKFYPHVWLLLLITLISITMLLFNYFTYHYQVAGYIGFNAKLILIPGILIYYFSTWIEKELPSIAFILYGLWLVIIATFIINLFTMAIQTTPYSLHDWELHRWDAALGFNVLDFMNWAYQYPWLIKITSIAYITMIIQLIVIPIILIFLQQQRRFSVYINICLISAIIGYLIYFFYPSSNPAHIFRSPHFTQIMYSAVQRFYDVQNYIPNDNLAGGIIGFPSFHTIWAICAVYAFRNYKIIFWPLLFWNIITILGTLTLGWHFLVDILSGILIVILSIPLAEYWSFGKDYTFLEMKQRYHHDFKKMSANDKSLFKAH